METFVFFLLTYFKKRTKEEPMPTNRLVANKTPFFY